MQEFIPNGMTIAHQFVVEENFFLEFDEYILGILFFSTGKSFYSFRRTLYRVL